MWRARGAAVAVAMMSMGPAIPAGAATGCGRDRAVAGADVCLSRTDSRSATVYRVVRDTARAQHLRATLFSVQSGGRRVAEGALGQSLGGVRARRDMHFRAGNVNEGMLTTLLLQLVQRGKIRLDDPVRKYDRRIYDDRACRWPDGPPTARRVTVGMLARSTSGLRDYITDPDFVSANNDDPFRNWTSTELLSYSHCTLFTPGTDWAFSDTNFTLLGDIVARAGHAPLARQMHDRIWKPLGLRDTRAPSNGVIQEPALHGYWGGRGVYEDTTFWDPTWARNAGNLTTDLHDLAIWARAIARGTVLTPASHRLQTGNINVGIGHNSPARHYGMGIAVLDGWVLTNPQVPGYNIVQAYQPARKLTVVVVTTLSRRNSSTRHYSTLVFLKLARALTGSAPPLAIDPRPTG